MGLRPAKDGRPLPAPNPTTQPFFDGAAEGRQLLQRCPRHGFFFYPRSLCPSCLGDDWSWEEASGRGSVHAFTVDRTGHDPTLASETPFVIAIVELEEGPRMTARIVGCPPEEVRVGQAVEASFETIEDVALVRFRPAA